MKEFMENGISLVSNYLYGFKQMFDQNKNQIINIISGSIAIYISIKFVKKCANLYKIIKKRKRLENNIGSPPSHWIIGNIYHFSNPSTYLQQIIHFGQMNNGIFILKLGPFNYRVIITSADYAKDLLSSAVPKDSFVVSISKHWLGMGLLFSEGETWKRKRVMLNKAFRTDILKPYCDVFSDCTLILVNKWKTESLNGKQIDLIDCIHKFSLDSLLKCIFGIESNVQLNESYQYLVSAKCLSEDLNKQIHSILCNISPFLYFLRPSSWKPLYELHKMHVFTQSVIKERQKLLKENNNYSKNRKYLDFIDMLILAKDVNGNSLTMKEIQDEVNTFMFAGHDTTASGLAFALYNLAKYPDFQEHCRSEVISVMGDSERLSWDDVGKMTFLTQFLKESLRLYPPVPGIPNEIKKDTTIFSFIYAMHRDPKYFPDPEKFDPERFSPSQTKEPFSYIPFSTGPRVCIGQNFALTEMKICMAIILKNFRLKRVENHEPIVGISVTLTSLNGLKIELEEL